MPLTQSRNHPKNWLLQFSLCSRAPLWAVGWGFGSIIATGQWHSLPPPLWLSLPYGTPESPSYSQDWAWGPVHQERNCKWSLSSAQVGNPGKNLVGSRGVWRSVSDIVLAAPRHHQPSAQQPSWTKTALLGLFQAKWDAHRKWLCSSLPSESVLKLSGTSQQDLPQKMLNNLWSISNHVPFLACSSGWAPGAVILTPSACPKDLMHFLSRFSVLKPSLPWDSSHRCKCRGCSHDLCQKHIPCCKHSYTQEK